MAIAKDVNEYIASAPATHRAALKRLRAQVKKVYPRVTEHISYRVPLFKLDGHPLAAFSAAKHHVGFFVWSSSVLPKLASRLTKYDVGKGTIRFTPTESLPDALVKAIVVTRAKEIKERWPDAAKKVAKKKAKAKA
jgi:uncharacterized protein YdhG (YjbR/CyaY superfamily)